MISSRKSSLLLLAALPVGALVLAAPARADLVAEQAPKTLSARPSDVPVAEDGITIIMSPFTVKTTSQDLGYRATNTLAGSRLNSNVADLASSITVVTHQQLLDTASTDLNDVFLYEANTEGASNYTPIVIDRSGLKDQYSGYSISGNSGLTSSTANRIRGLSSADTAWNFYPSIARLKADVYNLDTVEISRGPNSILFGLGSPAGIVNESLHSASLRKDSAELNLRYGSYGSFRSGLSFNKVLIKGKLAVYGAALYNDQEFRRKPSYDISRRQTLAATFKPFSKTTLKAWIERYSDDARIPNSLTPRDGITPWINAGRPVWDPLTQTVSWLDRSTATTSAYTTTRTAVGSDGVTYKGDNVLTSVYSPYYVEGLTFQDYSRPAMYVNTDGSYTWSQRQATIYPTGYTSTTVIADPTMNAIYQRRTTSSNVINTPANFASNYISPGLSNKSLYNYEDINIAAANYSQSHATSYNLELEQQLTRDLFLSVGYFKQDYRAVENYSLSQISPMTVYIDTNRNNTDGTVNTHFLSPYVDDLSADTVQAPEINENYRAMLAYDLDFSNKEGALKWFGRHRILGLASHQEDTQSRIRQRIAMVDGDSRYVTAAASRTAGWNYAANTTAIHRYYYLGDSSSTISRGPSRLFSNPGEGQSFSGSIRTYNYATGTWENVPVTLATVNYAAGNGLTRSNKKIDTLSFATQSFFLKDRIVSTVGLRRDSWKARTNDYSDLSDSVLYPSSNNNYLVSSDYLLNKYGNWERLNATTGSFGVVGKPLSWLSLSANFSNNFNPPTSAATNIFGKALPRPKGEGVDAGIAVNMLHNRLVAKVNFFRTNNDNERSGAVSTLISRLISADTTNFRAWAESVVRVRAGQNPSDSNWRSTSVYPLTDAQKSEIATMTGIPYDWTGSNVSSTQNDKARGIEYELVYNPTNYWNIKLNVARQLSTYGSIFPEYEAWYQQRLAVWKNAHATDMADSYTLSNGAVMVLRDYWSSATNFGGNAKTSTPTASTPETWYATNVASELANARLLQGARTAGQRDWRANLLSNYEIHSGVAKGVGFGGAVRWEDKAIVGYRGAVNASGQYYANNLLQPIYDTDLGVSEWRDLTHLDLWVSYRFRVWSDKVGAKVQLNLRDALENGGIRPVYTNWDGSVAAYRIIDSRQFTCQVSFDF